MGLCEGECRGVITEEPKGEHGFGYDPVFFISELGRTMAELTPEEKNRISHRARAAEKARQVLMGWGQSI
jgi:XTP/dITP diphosphohydrolase